jgi:hypothetical protein
VSIGAFLRVGPARSHRLPHARVAAALFVAATASACVETVNVPEVPRTLQVTAADGGALPSVFACPVPFGEGFEAWVAFGGGTLTFWQNGTYEWTYNVGEGYGYHGPAGVRTARGWSRTERGGYRVDAAGTLTFLKDGNITGTGRLTDQGAEFQSAPLSCPHAPPGTPEHIFTLQLR